MWRGGSEAAKKAGRHLGRPPALTGEQRREARRMIQDDGRPYAEVSRLFKVHESTLRRCLNSNGNAQRAS